MAEGGLLKLRAVDGDDLAVVAGALQDAIVPIGDMAFDRAAGRFHFAANRYRWEAGARARVNCGVTFANVVAVKRRNVDFRARTRFLNLLTLALAEGGADAPVHVVLTFSEDAAIRLETTGLLCHLEDFGEPWPTQWRPDHGE